MAVGRVASTDWSSAVPMAATKVSSWVDKKVDCWVVAWAACWVVTMADGMAGPTAAGSVGD